MPYEFFENAGEKRMRASGATLEVFFAEVMRGMFAYMKPRIFHNNDAEADRVIKIAAKDAPALLADFLGATVRLALENNELYEEVRFTKLTETELEAELYGREVQQFDREAKAVTCHGSKINRNAGGAWEVEISFGD